MTTNNKLSNREINFLKRIAFEYIPCHTNLYNRLVKLKYINQGDDINKEIVNIFIKLDVKLRVKNPIIK